MATYIDLSFRDPRKASLINRKFVGVAPEGPLSGFRVTPGSADGLYHLSAGLLLSAEGVRIEETASQDDFNLTPASINSSGQVRYDMVVASYVYAEAEPVPAVSYTLYEDMFGSANPPPGAGDYLLAYLRVPDGTNAADRIIHSGRAIDQPYSAAVALDGTLSGPIRAEIAVGDGRTAFAELTGLGGVQTAIDELSLRGGGIVRLAGSDWSDVWGIFDDHLKMKSNVIVTGAGKATVLRRSAFNPGAKMFGFAGAQSAAGATIAGSNRLDEAALDFRDYGVGSKLDVMTGADAGAYRIVEAADGYCLLAAWDSGEEPSFGGSTGASFGIRLAGAGLCNLWLDAAGLSSAAVEIGRLVDGLFYNCTIINSGATVAAAIASDGPTVNCRFLDCVVGESGGSAFTHAFDLGRPSGLEIEDNQVRGCLFYDGDVRIQSTGAGRNLYVDNLAAGTVTLPAATGWWGEIETAEHNVDGTHTASNLAIVDAGDYFSPDNIESALQELGAEDARTDNPHDVTYSQAGAAPAAEGVTNGNSHDHAGGDGAQIPEGGIGSGAVTESKIGSGAVTESKVSGGVLRWAAGATFYLGGAAYGYVASGGIGPGGHLVDSDPGADDFLVSRTGNEWVLTCPAGTYVTDYAISVVGGIADIYGTCIPLVSKYSTTQFAIIAYDFTGAEESTSYWFTLQIFRAS